MGVRVRFREVSAYGRCPLPRGVRFREVSAYGRFKIQSFRRETAGTAVCCLLMRGVRLQQVSVSGGSTVVLNSEQT